MECNPEMIQSHTKDISSNCSDIASLTKTVDRHEKMYDILMSMGSTQSQLLVEIKRQGDGLEKIVEDVEYLKENAETKATVERIHERVDILENKDGIEAIKAVKAFKRWLLFGAGSIIISVATVGILILLKLQ